MTVVGHEADAFLSAHGCRWGVPREMHWICRGARVVDYWTGWGGWYRTVTPLPYAENIKLNLTCV